jgi:hypothetical protein
VTWPAWDASRPPTPVGSRGVSEIGNIDVPVYAIKI